ncbi:TonB-dependent siderophore receptor [Variovorax sp. KBW07]|uniref:TonB-dependent siderophore receptor n=1 Tax=Variovorax sp. KBW07 TaxID=2153358 RepID=UPI000F58CD9E|nr:TonB-dependent receptor [Variovorax sp. KBW07]RQO61599.1 TonB-dependent siderophore receptor [Variovorax sp. KBW07]
MTDRLPVSPKLALQANPQRQIVRAIHSALCALGLTAASLATTQAWGADTSAAQARRAYNIPAGPLGPALLSFAGQAGVNLSIDLSRTRNLTTPGLSGEFSVEEGFGRLLAGSGLRTRRLGDGNFTLDTVTQPAALGAAATQAPVSTVAGTEAPGAALPAVTVTARTQSDLMAPTRQVTVLEREELDTLRQGSDSVATLLSKVVPGMADSSHTITDFGQTLRGRNMLVLVDGIPLNTNRDSSRNLANINPADVDQIEVLRGSSAIYGSGAAGGIVSIRTRQPSGEPRAETTITGVAPLSRLGSAGLGGEVQHYISGGGEVFDYAVSLGARRVGGSFDARGDRLAPEPSQGDLFDSNIYNASAKIGYRIDADQRLQFSASHYDAKQDTDYASDASVAKLPAGSVAARSLKGLQLDKQNRVTNSLLGLDYTNRDIAGSTLAAQLYYRDFFTRFAPFDARAVAARGANVDQVTQNSRVFGGRLTVKTPFGADKKTQLTWGADFNEERTDMPLDVFDPKLYDASRGLRFSKTGTLIFMPPITTRSLGGFAQLQHRFNDSWSVEGGARYDKASARFDSFRPLSQLRARNPGQVAGGALDYGAWTYNAGVVFNPSRHHDIYASYSQGFELPDIGLQVRNASPSFNIRGSNLQPVKTDTVEFGWRGRFDNAVTNLSVFQSQSALGAVQSSFNGLIMTRTKERIHGIEGAIDYAGSNDRWGVGGSFTWMKGRELPQGGARYQDMWGYRIPPLKLTAYVEYKPSSRWSHRLQAVSYGSKDYRLDGVDSFGRRDVRGYTTVDLVSRFKIDDRNTLVVGVENLLNRHYFPLYSQLLRNSNNTSRLPAAGAVLKVSYSHRW